MIVPRKIVFSAQVCAVIGLIYFVGQDAPSTSQAQGQGQGQVASQAAHDSVPGEVLIQFRRGASEAAKARARGRAGAEAQEVIVEESRRDDEKGDLELARIPPGLAIADAVRGIESDPDVEFAEPNWVYQHTAVSNDPYYTNGSLWGMYGDASNVTPKNTYGSQAAEAWAAGHTGSKSVYVGVIDEGIQYNHSDLSGQIWTNPFDPADGIDNDGNGYVDDIRGWDFAGNNNSIYDGGTSGNRDDHGTHVAGTIGAKMNGSGVVGVNWNITLISAKFLGSNGGTTANAIKAVDYLTNLKIRHGLNIVATNNSWGGGGFSQGLLDAIKRGAAQNILFIAAAGNGGFDGVGDNNDVTPHYPSNYTTGNSCDVISVAAITSSGSKSSFSNYGLNSVDIGAPGSGIWSTTAYNRLSSYSGTSMATPHVTGAAALYAATFPGSSCAVIRSAILTSATPTASMSNRTVTGGRLNAGGF